MLERVQLLASSVPSNPLAQCPFLPAVPTDVSLLGAALRTIGSSTLATILESPFLPSPSLSKHSSTAVTRPFSSLEPKAVRKLSRETRPESHAVSKQQNNSQSLQDLKAPKFTYKIPTHKLKQQTSNCTTASGQQKSHA